MIYEVEMWEYWRDKVGVVRALEQQFPDVLAVNSDLKNALFAIKSAEALIDNFFTREIERQTQARKESAS